MTTRRLVLGGIGAAAVLAGLPSVLRDPATDLLALAAATPQDIDGYLFRVPGSQQWVAQLTGQVGPFGRPVLNPSGDIGVGGTDLGVPVEHQGELWFLFGPNPGRIDHDTDAIALTGDWPGCR